MQRIGRLLHLAADLRALHDGLEVGQRHRGLGRRYREPGFDRLRECPECAGLGYRSAVRACSVCLGNGRIDLRRYDVAGERPTASTRRGWTR